jgi:putative membrane protein
VSEESGAVPEPGSTPSGSQRLHPAAIAVWIVEFLGRFGLGLIPLLVLRARTVLVVLAIAVPAVVIGSILRYRFFSFRLEGGAFIIQGGVVGRWRRVIPLARIQSVDTVQKLRHRALGVVELRIEAVGGSQTEGTLSALAPREADRIRARLLGEAPIAAGAIPVPPPPALARLRPVDLLLAGVTGGRVAVIAVLLGYLQELAPDDLIVGALERAGTQGRATVLVLVAAVVVFLVASLLISLVATVLVYWDFELRREGNRLVVTRGLLEKRRAVVPLRRIQALRIEENLVRRVVGMASLAGVLAGYAGEREEQRETGTLLPAGRRGDVIEVARQILQFRVGELLAAIEPAPARALVPRLLRAVAVGLVAGLVGVAAFDARGAIAFLAVPAGALWAVASWRSLGHAVAGDHTVVRSGVLVRRTTVVPLANLQHLTLSTRPLRRMLGLATVTLAIPKARPAAIDLDRGRARDRFARLARTLVEPRSVPL